MRKSTRSTPPCISNLKRIPIINDMRRLDPLYTHLTGFNLIEASTDTLAVTHYLYFEGTGKFAAISKHVFPRQGRTFDAGSGSSPT